MSAVRLRLSPHTTAVALTAGLALVALAARPAAAQITLYTSAATYNAASLPIASISFDGLLANQNSFNYYGNPGGLSVAGVTFTTPSGTDLFLIGPGAVDGGGHSFNFPGDGTATLDPEHGSPSVLDIALPTGVSAVGTQIGGFYSSAALTITVNGSSMFTYTAPAAHTGLGYIGFTDTAGPITSISISDPTFDVNNANMVLDNVTYGIASPAPEPSALVGLVLGAVALGGLVVKARRRTASAA